MNLRQDWPMSRSEVGPIRVMRVIARMNVGGPAVQVSGLMRGFDTAAFDQRLYTGFCDFLSIAPTKRGVFFWFQTGSPGLTRSGALAK